MEKLSLLGEFLYIILGYEKRRIRTNKLWFKKYLISLNDTMELCLEIVHCLNNVQISITDYDLIIRCLEKVNNISKNNFKTTNINLESNIDIEDSKLKIINRAIELIINDINELLHKRGKGYKEEVGRLLMAVHNFPRFYLIGDGYLFVHRGLRLSFNQIKEYSKLSLSDFEISRLFISN